MVAHNPTLLDRLHVLAALLPHAADAWYVSDSVKTGYEKSFTRYFYKPQRLRSLQKIRADIPALEKETEWLLEEIMGGGNANDTLDQTRHNAPKQDVPR